MRAIVFLLVGAVLCGSTSAAADEAHVVFRVTDAEGRPVAGVELGTHAGWSDRDFYRKYRERFATESGKPDQPLPERPVPSVSIGGTRIETDEQGLARVAQEAIYREGAGDQAILIYAVQVERKLAAFVEIKANDRPLEIEIALQPACEVRGRLTSKQLAEVDRELTWTNVYVYVNEDRPLTCQSFDQDFRFLLPPGQYKLWAYGTNDTYSAKPVIDIAPGTRQLDVEIDLPASRLGTLFGRPAPELKQIKGWKNGGPVTLAELKGRVVLLDFWGYWCGPCIGAMPDLMKWHDKYADEGLAIIAVHDDSVESVAAMDAKLIGIRDQYWAGRDLPFLVALDGGGEVKVPGLDRKARGATTAEYGIRSFPTTILIDREGKIAALDLYHEDPQSEKTLRKILGIHKDVSE